MLDCTFAKLHVGCKVVVLWVKYHGDTDTFVIREKKKHHTFYIAPFLHILTTTPPPPSPWFPTSAKYTRLCDYSKLKQTKSSSSVSIKEFHSLFWTGRSILKVQSRQVKPPLNTLHCMVGRVHLPFFFGLGLRL